MTQLPEFLKRSLLEGLPEGWNPNRDVLFAFGPHASHLIELHRAIGQQRFVLVLPDGGVAPEPLAPGIVAVPPDLVSEAIRTFGEPRPELVHRVPIDDTAGTQEFLDRVRNEARRGLSEWRVNEQLIARTGAMWLDQTLKNLPVVARHPSVAELAEILDGAPVVCVSPGPSLSSQLDPLARAAKRAIVVCGSHALSALLEHEIRVDFVVVQDAGEIVLRHFEGVDLSRVGALVASTNVRPELARLDIARKFFFAANGPLDDWIFPDPRARLSSGGSVACAAFSLANLVGANPIVLVGQDLALSADGRYYAEETLDGAARVEFSEAGFHLVKPPSATGPGLRLDDGRLQFTRTRRVTRIAGYGGGEVTSTQSLIRFRDWFQDEAKRFGPVRRLVNATGGGARIAGFEERSLESLLADWPERSRLDVEELPRATDEAMLRLHVLSAAAPDGRAARFVERHDLLPGQSLEERVRRELAT